MLVVTAVVAAFLDAATVLETVGLVFAFDFERGSLCLVVATFLDVATVLETFVLAFDFDFKRGSLCLYL